MLTEQTDTLTGRQLDRALAEALGWQREDIPPTPFWRSPEGWVHDADSLPPFSADTPEGWSAMRIVVERMRELGYKWEIEGDFCLVHPGAPVNAAFRTVDGTGFGAWGKSAPEAVARASLAALSAKEASDA